jgi:cell division protein FtsL
VIVNKNSNLAYRYDYNAEPAYVPDYYPPRRQPARTAPKPVRPAPGSVPHPRRQAKAKAQGLKKSQKFVVIMMVFITAAVFIGIIWRYSIIHDENLTVGNIKEHITEQADRNEKLKMELINQKNLQIVSEKAKGLGMKFPNGEQIIYYGAETTTDNTP